MSILNRKTAQQQCPGDGEERAAPDTRVRADNADGGRKTTNMSIKKFIEENSFVVVAVVFATGVSIGWATSDHLRVKPLELQLAQSEATRRNIYEVIIPRITETKAPAPEPAQQCEIVGLYEQLATAIEKGNVDAVAAMYLGNTTFSGAQRHALLKKYRPLMGMKAHYYLSLLYHNDDGTISVCGKAFFADRRLIRVRDRLVYEGRDWKILYE